MEAQRCRATREYWEGTEFNRLPSNPTSLFQPEFDRWLPKRKDWSVIEIGACPGHNLAALARSHGYHPVALDILPRVHELPAMFREFGIPDLESIEQDLLTLQTDRRFNIVISFGFIEHFDNVEPILRRHWELVAPGGFLVVGLPIFGAMQMALRRLVLTPEQLEESLRIHNTDIMDMSVLRGYCEALPDIQILKCAYIWNMDTWLSPKHPHVRRDRRLILALWKLASLLPKALRVSSKLLSPYGLIVARKGEA
ncbi:MAG TPA: class I SAM-dependent methyltransferase [Chthonomonadaceae bacterium]|nr:class I SAM-dependent methyltransferase [Chthonomonadaceae bacterium]